MRMRSLLVPLALLVLVACERDKPPKAPDEVAPIPPSAIVEGDGLGTPIGDACANLRRLGCPEGFPHPRTKRSCFESYTRASVSVGVGVPAACLAGAASAEVARGCGDANTIRVRCVLPAAGVAGSEAP